MNYREALIPTSRPQRTGRVMAPTSITVHNTANPDASADANARYFAGRDLQVSVHIFVDDKEAVLSVPVNEQAWHTGTSEGNRTSVGVEVCEFTDPARQAQANANAQALLAAMMDGTAPAAFRVNTTTIRTHQSWSGKYCPRLLLPVWDEFKAGIKTGGTMAYEPAPDGLTRWYRLTDARDDFFYTTSTTENGNGAYRLQGTAFDVVYGDTPLYEFLTPSGFHFYTVSEDEKSNLLNTTGFKYVGIRGLVGSSGTPVYRLVKGERHLYTTSLDETHNAICAGWKSEDIGWYLGIKPVGKTWQTVYESATVRVQELR